MDHTGRARLVGQLDRYIHTLERRYSVQIVLTDLCGGFFYNPDLRGMTMRLSFHDNAYCNQIKKESACFSRCLQGKHRIEQRCRTHKSWFFGFCPFGIGEFVFPVFYGSDLLGFLCVGPYRHDPPNRCAQDLQQRYAAFSPMPDRQTVRLLTADFTALSNLFAYVYACCGAANGAGLYDSALVNKAVAYIRENYREELTLQSVADACFCNRNYLCGLFYKVTDKHLADYINEVRIGQAIHLMRMSDLNITQIAAQVGYNDSSYFSKVFRKQMACSPKQYKMNILQKNAE